MNVVYREARYSDLEEIKNIVNICFSFSNYVDNEKVLDTFLDYYVNSCFVEQTFMRVATVNQQVIGIIMCGVKKDMIQVKKLPFLVQTLTSQFKLKMRTTRYHCGIDDYQHILAVYQSFLKRSDKMFDGILTLFAILPTYQGYGIGSSLWNKAQQYYQARDIKHIYLFTDSSCNYAFYDKKGFLRLESEKMKIHKDGNDEILDIFMYGYRWNHTEPFR